MQPKPIKNTNKPVWESVIEDMKARDELGLQRYGTRLQPFNGRDSMQDLFEELLDAVVYLKQYLIERDANK